MKVTMGDYRYRLPNIFKNLKERSKFKMLLYCLWKDYNYCKKHNEYWNLQCRYYDTWYT